MRSVRARTGDPAGALVRPKVIREITTASDPAPPFALPGEHFAAALTWLVVGSLGLVVVAPMLARGAFFLPHVIAVTHCFTLGWIATSIFGALYQIYPVALGVEARSVRVGHATFVVLQLGILTLVAGAWWWRPVLLATGWVLLFCAVGGVSWNLLPARRRATRGHRLAAYVVAAHSGLGLAMFVIVARIGMELGWWRVDRMAILAAHVHLAVVGFATLMIVGIGARLLPMFFLASEAPETPLRWIGPLLGTGVLAYAAGRLAGLGHVAGAGAGLMTVGVALYVGLVVAYVRRGRRRAPDPALALLLVAVVYLTLATVLGDYLLVRDRFLGRLDVAYAILGVIGWVSLFVMGVYHKIIPFLTWLDRFGARAGVGNVPSVADLVRRDLAWFCGGALAIGTATLAVGVAIGHATAARAGAVFLTCGAAAACLQFGRVRFARGATLTGSNYE